MGWDVVHDWMLTGRFEWRVPLRGVVLTWQYNGGRPPMDWWGIQYYSRLTLLRPDPCLSSLLLGKKMYVMVPGDHTLTLRAVPSSGHAATSQHLSSAHATSCMVFWFQPAFLACVLSLHQGSCHTGRKRLTSGQTISHTGSLCCRALPRLLSQLLCLTVCIST